jgi:hypothetical protein
MRAARREIRSDAQHAGPDALVNSVIELDERFTPAIINVNRVGDAAWVIAFARKLLLERLEGGRGLELAADP